MLDGAKCYRGRAGKGTGSAVEGLLQSKMPTGDGLTEKGTSEQSPKGGRRDKWKSIPGGEFQVPSPEHALSFWKMLKKPTCRS